MDLRGVRLEFSVEALQEKNNNTILKKSFLAYFACQYIKEILEL